MHEWFICVRDRHIQIHIFARPASFPDELMGGRSFALLKVTPQEAVPPNEIISFCELLRDKFVYMPQV